MPITLSVCDDKDYELAFRVSRSDKNEVLEGSDYDEKSQAVITKKNVAKSTRIIVFGGWRGINGTFLEEFPTLKCLTLPETVKEICMTPKLEKMLHDNDVLIQGRFDSFASEFAEQNNLRFRQDELTIAYYKDRNFRSEVWLSLVFGDGSVKIKYHSCDERHDGSSMTDTDKGFCEMSFPDALGLLRLCLVQEVRISETNADVLLEKVKEEGILEQFLVWSKTHKMA